MYDIFDKLNIDFYYFINNENNKRIFFSGKFGIGKTTFLKQFFNEYKEEFNLMHLFPVNYSVTSNEDIFRQIKFDILNSLILDYDVKISTIKIKESTYLPHYILKNLRKVLYPLILWQGNGITLKAHSFVEKEINAFVESYKIDTKDEINEYDSFAFELMNREGSIYEKNVITELIISSLEEISSNGKKNVLILDDLDRLDPKHIFRILNVLASHFDYSENHKRIFGDNKFNFDTIVLVGHLDNIESIFHHVYGQKADFNGFFDKFYSSFIYHYDNNERVNILLENIVKKYKVQFEDSTEKNQNIEKRLEEIKSIFILPILKILNGQNLITFRSLVKYLKEPVIIPQNELKVKWANVSIDSFDIDFCIGISFLCVLVGDMKHLIKLFERLEYKKGDLPENINSEFLRIICFNLLADFHKFEKGNSGLTFECEMPINEMSDIQVKFRYANTNNEKGNAYQSIPFMERKTTRDINPVKLIILSCKKLQEWNFKI